MQNIISKLKDTSSPQKVRIQSSDLTINRTSSKTVAEPGEEVNITITLYNNGTYDMSSVFVTETFTGATFKNRSVYIGGISYGDANPNSGFNLNVIIAPGNSETITYGIIMDDPMPEDSRVATITTDITYKIDRFSYSTQSDPYSIEFTHGDIAITKTADKTVAGKGQKIKYQCIVRNTGTLQDYDVVFKDVIPTGTTFVGGSVAIDGVWYSQYDPVAGFSLGTIDGKSQKVVVFEVVVD